MLVGRLDILRGIAQNKVTDLQWSEVDVVMEEAVILEDVVVEVMVVIKMVEVMVVTKMAEVIGKLEPLHHNMVGAMDRQTIGPIVTLSLGGLKRGIGCCHHR